MLGDLGHECNISHLMRKREPCNETNSNVQLCQYL